MRVKTIYKAKILAVAMLAAAAWTGCTKNTVDNPENASVPVYFSTYSSRPISKAGSSYIAPGDNFITGHQIGVFGFYHSGSGTTDGAWTGADKPNFMYDQLVECTDGSSHSWEYSPIKYWPNEDGIISKHAEKLSFWGYYPYNATGLSFLQSGSSQAYTNTSTGLPKVTFTQQEDPDNMIDLMFSQLESNLTKPTVNDAVTLRFRHALALVEFELAEGTGAEVNSLELTNILKTGTLNDPSTLSWTGQTGSFGISQSGITVSGTKLLSILVVPQTINADATFTLNYNIQFASSDPSVPAPIVYTGESASAKLFKTGADAYGVTAWEAGRHYIYMVSAGLDRIEFEEIVESADDWSVGNGNISVPD